MHELYQCLEIAKMAWNLLRRTPKLALIPLCCMLPALLSLFFYALGGSIDAVWNSLLLTSLLAPTGRIATGYAVFATLRGESWTLGEALQKGAQHWMTGIFFGVLDIIAGIICSWLVIYALFGTFAAAFWVCMSALIPCAIAAGYTELPRAMARSERVFALIRIELLFPAVLITVALGLLLSLFNLLGLLDGIGACLFIILILAPVREIIWQVFVSAAYHQNAPARY
ncbi:MAG TPA: hypothetical protein VFJ58_24910 [Armatimonadota bacterium]|nr:hypothetical protein [Armatimonadota bacterium]